MQYLRNKLADTYNDFLQLQFKAAFHPCVNVYTHVFTSLSIDQNERVMSLGLLNFKQNLSTIKKVSTDRASMILGKHEQSVLQSLCSIYQHFLDLFISLYAIHIH